MTADTDTRAAKPPGRGGRHPGSSPRLDWPRLVVGAPGAIALTFLTMNAFYGLEPILIVLFLALSSVSYVGWRFPHRLGPLVVLTASASLPFTNLPYLVEGFGHPDTPLNFMLALILTTLSALAGVAAIGSLARWRPTGARRAVAAASLAVLIGAAVAVVATTRLEDDRMVAGDAVVAADDIAFVPYGITTASGVFIENHDQVRHTFTISSLGIDVELPANTARRVEIDAAPGTYEFHCAVPGHEEMRGSVTITS